MKEFKSNIEQDTVDNTNYRKVLFTAKDLQLVVMVLKPNEDIGMERHQDKDQFIRVEEGKGEAIINGNKYPLRVGDAVIIPQGSEHNIINTSKVRDLKIYTLYSKPEHPDLIVEATKAIADAKEPK